MKGSYSIKKVLPALVVGDSPYAKMKINEGLDARNNFKKLSSKDLTQKQKEEIKKNLKIYCEQDTKSMIDVLECLIAITNK